MNAYNINHKTRPGSQRIRPYTHAIRNKSTKLTMRPLTSMPVPKPYDASKLVADSITRIQSENAYKYIIKMSEADDLCKKLELEQKHKLVTAKDGTVKCELWQNGEFFKLMDIEEFEREHKRLKKTYFARLNLNIWQTSTLKKGEKLNFEDFEAAKENYKNG